MHSTNTRALLNWQRCFSKDDERENMRNHPGTKARERARADEDETPTVPIQVPSIKAREFSRARVRTACVGCLAGDEPCPLHAELDGFGGALLSAVEDGPDSWEFRDRPDVTTLGTRIKITTLKSGAERSYELEGFVHHPTDGGDPRRFYVLSGGVSRARTLLDRDGLPVAHAERAGRGFSLEFREWIARTVASDIERCGF